MGRKSIGPGGSEKHGPHPEVVRVSEFEKYLANERQRELEKNLKADKCNDRMRKDLGHGLTLGDGVFDATSLCLTVECLLIARELGIEVPSAKDLDAEAKSALNRGVPEVFSHVGERSQILTSNSILIEEQK